MIHINNVMIRTRFADVVFPVFGDRVQLQQVMLNLVMNGLEAMSSVSERTRELVVTTRNIDPGQVQITVEDSGTGVDPNTIERIFDPFYTSKAEGEGTGLGLSICHGIITEHGGKIEVKSKVNKGSCFRVIFPKPPALKQVG